MEKSENELINLFNTCREESLEFKEKYFYSLDKIKELETYLQQSQARERVLREALETIFNATSKRDYSTNEFNTVHKYAKEALEESK